MIDEHVQKRIKNLLRERNAELYCSREIPVETILENLNAVDKKIIDFLQVHFGDHL